jgi:hypothetical protein
MKLEENEKILIEMIERSVSKIKKTIKDLAKINDIRKILYNRKLKG